MPRKEDGDFSIPRPQGMLRTERPFEDYPQVTVIHQAYRQKFDDYTYPSFGTTHPTKGDHYFVADSPLEDLGGGIGAFVRTWAVIPPQRVIDSSKVWELPEAVGGSSSRPENTGWQSVTWYSNPDAGSTIFAPARDFVVGDQVLIGTKRFRAFASSWNLGNGRATVGNAFFYPPDEGRGCNIIAVADNRITVDSLFNGPVFEGQPELSIKRVSASKTRISPVAAARMIIDYFHLGVSPGIVTPGDIELQDAFDPSLEFNRNGVFDVAAFYNLANSGQYINAEVDTVERWMGLIYQRIRIQIKPGSYKRND
jgi:hypothetical protein